MTYDDYLNKIHKILMSAECWCALCGSFLLLRLKLHKNWEQNWFPMSFKWMLLISRIIIIRHTHYYERGEREEEINLELLYDPLDFLGLRIISLSSLFYQWNVSHFFAVKISITKISEEERLWGLWEKVTLWVGGYQFFSTFLTEKEPLIYIHKLVLYSLT